MKMKKACFTVDNKWRRGKIFVLCVDDEKCEGVVQLLGECSCVHLNLICEPYLGTTSNEAFLEADSHAETTCLVRRQCPKILDFDTPVNSHG